MKKLTFILSLILAIGLLSAIDYDLQGAYRVRAALMNNDAEKDGGWVDNRLNLGFDAHLHPQLSLRAAAEIGDTGWGSSIGELVHIKEAYVNYKLENLDASIRIGQQYYADKMGLFLDDELSGLLIQKEELFGMNSEFAWFKTYEGDIFTHKDYDIFMAHLNMADALPLGLYAYYGMYRDFEYNHLSLIPYYDLDLDIMQLDLAAFVDLQMIDDDSEVGFGAVAKLNADLDLVNVGADILFANKYGLTTISPWYQNGLYIYGIGEHHDETNLYWDTPYQWNGDSFMSIVGKFGMPINEKMKLFANAGYLTDLGMEINTGVELELIPDLLNLNLFGAYGISDAKKGPKNYLVGSSLKLEF